MHQPDLFWHLLNSHRVSYTFAPNSFVATAARYFEAYPPHIKEQLGYDFSKLKVLMCGGEVCRTVTVIAADKILTHYGAPPYSVKCSYGLSEVSCP